MMYGQMPASSPAHRKTADRASSRIYRIMLLHVLHRLEDIDFARELEGVAKSPIWMKDKRILRRELPKGLLSVRDELQFRKMIVAPMQPNIQTMLMSDIVTKTRRHDQPVGLD